MNYKVIVEVLLDINPVPFSFYRNFDEYDEAFMFKNEIFDQVKKSILDNDEIIIFEGNTIVRVENMIKVRVKVIDMKTHEEIIL